MNYIELVNRFWEIDENWQFTCIETRLYFYLIKTANRLGWMNNWTHSDDKTSANVGVSKNAMKNARNRLIQAGLISIKNGGNGFGDKTRYQIMIPKQQPNLTPNYEPNHTPTSTPITKLNKTKEEYNIPLTPELSDCEIIPKKEKEKSCAKKEKEDFDLNFIDVAFMGIVRDFIEYRKTIKKPFKTIRGVEMFYHELLKLSNNNQQKAKELADYAKGKEWQTVYQIKDNGTNQRTGTAGTERNLESLARNIEQGIIRGQQQ